MSELNVKGAKKILETLEELSKKKMVKVAEEYNLDLGFKSFDNVEEDDVRTALKDELNAIVKKGGEEAPAEKTEKKEKKEKAEKPAGEKKEKKELPEALRATFENQKVPEKRLKEGLAVILTPEKKGEKVCYALLANIEFKVIPSDIETFVMINGKKITAYYDTNKKLSWKINGRWLYLAARYIKYGENAINYILENEKKIVALPKKEAPVKKEKAEKKDEE